MRMRAWHSTAAHGVRSRVCRSWEIFGSYGRAQWAAHIKPLGSSTIAPAVRRRSVATSRRCASASSCDCTSHASDASR